MTFTLNKGQNANFLSITSITVIGFQKQLEQIFKPDATTNFWRGNSNYGTTVRQIVKIPSEFMCIKICFLS